MKRKVYFFAATLTLSFGFGQDITSDLKVCMPFSGNAQDASGNGNHGTVNGAVYLDNDRNGTANSAYHFTGGAADNISIGNFGGFIPDDELTVSMWADSDHETSTCLFMLDPDDANDRCVGCAMYKGMGLIWDYGDIFTGGRMTQSTTYDQNWHHYAYVISSSGNLQEIYMDGSQAATGPFVMTLNNRSLPLLIGAGASAISGLSIRWRGRIDDVCIYNRALTGTDIAALYNRRSACCVDPPGGGDGEGEGGKLTGVSKQKKSQKTLFYPVAYQTYQLQGDYSALNNIEVRSIEGKLLKRIEKSDISASLLLDLSSYSPGIYLVTATGSETQVIQRVLLIGN